MFLSLGRFRVWPARTGARHSRQSTALAHTMAKLLIVEDHELVPETLCCVTREAGRDCDCVGSKADALQVLAPGSHALVVSDVILPDGRGHDVVECAEQLGIPAILMSAHPDEIQSFPLGSAVHLIKPFDIEEFEKVLKDNVPPP